MKEADNKIAMRYYASLSPERAGFYYYSNPLDDPLAEIEVLGVAEIKRERIGEEKLSKLYHASRLPGRIDFYHSDSLDDPLAKIEPRVAETEGELIDEKKFIKRTMELVQQPSAIKTFGKKVAVVLAAAILALKKVILGQEGKLEKGVAGKVIALKKVMKRKGEVALQEGKAAIVEKRVAIVGGERRLFNLSYRLVARGLTESGIIYRYPEDSDEAHEAAWRLRRAIRQEKKGKLGAINKVLVAIEETVRQEVVAELKWKKRTKKAINEGERLALSAVRSVEKMPSVLIEGIGTGRVESIKKKAVEQARESVRSAANEEVELREEAVNKALAAIPGNVIRRVVREKAIIKGRKLASEAAESVAGEIEGLAEEKVQKINRVAIQEILFLVENRIREKMSLKEGEYVDEEIKKILKEIQRKAKKAMTKAIQAVTAAVKRANGTFVVRRGKRAAVQAIKDAEI